MIIVNKNSLNIRIPILKSLFNSSYLNSEIVCYNK